MTLKGRVLELTSTSAVLQNEKGRHSLEISQAGGAKCGDLVAWVGGELQVLTPHRGPPGKTPWTARVLDPRRLHAASVRERVEDLIREFFRARGFRETKTPLLVPCPGMEPHIRPFALAPRAVPGLPLFLPTSPEFAMKRLLVGGLERIFQICSAFRDEPHSITHSPEFTILEWYRAYAGYEEIQCDTEELFEFIARKLHGRPELSFQGRKISVAAPWPRLTVRALFQEYAGIDLVTHPLAADLARECERLGLGKAPALAHDSWDDLYFRIWLNVIEPKLPANQAIFVTRYPASQAALSVIETDPDGSRWARRFEVYAGGLELANAFEELTDPGEQRLRFEKDLNLRTEIYGADFPAGALDTPMYEGFLGALEEGLPPSGGIALGVDRMVMLFADEPDLNYTLWL